MSQARSTLVAVLLFVWMTAPAVRCLLPGEVLTPAERACCKAMAGQCAESGVLDHPCCKKTTAAAQPALPSAPAAAAATVPIVFPIPVMVRPQIEWQFAAGRLLDPSPPPALEQSNPVLRI